MPREATYLLFTVVCALILLFVIFFIAPIIFDMIARAQKQVSPTSENKTEVVIGTFKTLGIRDSDPPDIKVYKLFKYFDPMFVNETNGNKIKYSSFILDLGTYEYDGFSGTLIDNLTAGIRNFSAIDRSYQVGNVVASSISCLPVKQDLTLSYSGNECWNQAQFNALSVPCEIWAHGDALGKFNGKMKIRVGWIDTGSTYTNGKEIINVFVTLCDG
jgi:hypothetical protein